MYSYIIRSLTWLNTIPSKAITLHIFIFVFFLGWVANISAQQADIAILLPSTSTGISEGDVSYARSVSKRFIRMLKSIGFNADEIDESAAASKNRFQNSVSNPYKLVILPLNQKISLDTAVVLNAFVDRGGKLFVTYNLADEVGKMLNVRSKKWMRRESPGQFSTIQFDAPDVLGLPNSVRQVSWNITVAEATDPTTKVIGHWYNSDNESTGYPAFFLGNAGVFFSHVFLPDDIQTKTQLLAALLGHMIPEFQHAIAKRELDALTTIGHITDLDLLSKFVDYGGVSEAKHALHAGKTMSIQARTNYANKKYHEAMNTSRQGREELAKAYNLSHLTDTTEGRAIWNHSGLGAYPGDWERSAKELADAGINMILPNMAWGGIAHYDSSVLPQSSKFTQYGDQIQQCVQAAKKYNLEVHIWKITWNLEGAPEDFVKNLRDSGRTQVSSSGEPINWLCPSHPENVKLELDSIMEIVQKYDIDGIHLDYIRYPGGHACFCQGCQKRFMLSSRINVQDWPKPVLPNTGQYSKRYSNWRVDQITRLVRLIHKRIHNVNKDIKLSTAVFGGYPSCVTSIGQDWIAWAKAGYIDFVCPMNYTEDNKYFTDLLENQLALMPKGVAIYPGIGATASNSILTPDGVVGQIHLLRFLGASGWCIFNYSSNISNTILPAIELSVGKKKAKPVH
ncbi:family 10 glycosylhydrolase [Candidatus Poribacteria bacterium]|nr:family 10 glycosylhydrolase [Candidatus Poribacteria bacterium]